MLSQSSLVGSPPTPNAKIAGSSLIEDMVNFVFFAYDYILASSNFCACVYFSNFLPSNLI